MNVLKGFNVLSSIFKWRAYLIGFTDRTRTRKRKELSEVYLFLFVKVAKCSNAGGVRWWAVRCRGRWTCCRSAVSVAELLSGVSRDMFAANTVADDSRPKPKTQDCSRCPLLYSPCLSFGTEVRNFLQRLSVGHRGDSPCYCRCWKFRTTSLGLKLPRGFKNVLSFRQLSPQCLNSGSNSVLVHVGQGGFL